ncbi:hypothetical protein C1I97_20730 [Streptomyces sp. NTH33]|uniref:hypothetical protein n=1 Tax=Streptomyces sp. NTH33 TaxID=1735453 RepID=UPI000DA728CC|nr:hypothetical protein [Streptomyces sp. NTH33]PZH02862.1 hypothetical protein C1I97_20730 [Streptomyces sp. NTH33]
MPERLKKLIGLGREPLYSDVELETTIGEFTSRLSLYVSAFGSTQVASHDPGEAFALETRTLTSAVGKYHVNALDLEDLLLPAAWRTPPAAPGAA